MNFKQWFNEAVEYEHENFSQFYRKWKNRVLIIFTQMSEPKIEAIQANLKKLMRDGENECTNMIENWAESAHDLLESYKNSIKNMYSKPIEMAEIIINQKHYEILENLTKHGTNFWSMKKFIKLDTSWYSYQEIYDYMLGKLSEPDSEDFVKRYCGEETEIVFNKVLNDTKMFLSNVDKLKSLIKSFDNQMAIWARSSQRKELKFFGKAENIKDTMPAHEPFEYLYHASSNVPAIIREGFKTKKELGRPTGLGGGSSDLISFTANPKIARAIANSLKMAVRISKGELTFDNIAQKYKKLGLLGDEDIQSAKEGYSKDPKEQTFNLYRLALMAIESRSVGYNPTFGFPAFNEFSKTDINNIGVIKAKIDMSKVKEYLPAEEEYRVPVDAISEISIA